MTFVAEVARLPVLQYIGTAEANCLPPNGGCEMYPRSHRIRDFIVTFRADGRGRRERRLAWEQLRAGGTLALSFAENAEPE